METISATDVLLRHAEPGQAIVGLFDIDEGEVAAILIRETAERAMALPEAPALFLGSGGLLEDAWGAKVIVCVVVVYVQGVDRSYEVWLNYHNPAHRRCFERLAHQRKLLFRFYVDGPEPIRSVYLPNPFSAFATQLAEAAATMPAWTSEQFDVAKVMIESRHPDPRSLWDALTPKGEATFDEMGAAARN